MKIKGIPGISGSPLFVSSVNSYSYSYYFLSMLGAWLSVRLSIPSGIYSPIVFPSRNVDLWISGPKVIYFLFVGNLQMSHPFPMMFRYRKHLSCAHLVAIHAHC